MKIAFVGMRHGHIFSLYDRVMRSPDWEVVAVCEENPADSLLAMRPDIPLTHTDFGQMLETVECDVVAVGDCYGLRGERIVRALSSGRHVISDKPLCTSLVEWNEIRRLSDEKKCKVGCMYEMRGSRCFSILREQIARGTLGKIVQIQFCGQHPLNRGRRPGWYFEKGKHGGTINDIAGHAIDIIPWMTGLAYKRIVAARTWKALADKASPMNDAAQFMLEMENGCGVMGDVSYQGVDSFGFTLPAYWRFNVWGSRAMAECSRCGDSVMLYENGQTEGRLLTECSAEPVDYLASFQADLENRPASLDTPAVLAASRFTLEIQAFADGMDSGE